LGNIKESKLSFAESWGKVENTNINNTTVRCILLTNDIGWGV
jgi:hypothetical protein